MKQLLSLSLVAFAALALQGIAVRAQIPNNMAYQGYLTKNGTPFNGQSVLDIFMYDAPTGGTQVWSQRQTAVQVTQGYYSTMLDFSPGQHWSQGTQSFNKAYWLEINLDGQQMPQRIQLAVSPYAFSAHTADSAIHIPQAPVGTIVAYAGSITQLKNYESRLGWYVCDGRLIPRDSFPDYDRNVSTLYGSNNFGDSLALPDLRGLFLRGVNTGTGSSGQYAARTDSLADPQDGRMAPSGLNATANRTGVGSIQSDELKRHTHKWVGSGGAGTNYASGLRDDIDGPYPPSDGIIQAAGGTE